MNKAFISATIYFTLIFSNLSAQTKTERDNRAVFNRIEYFFNTQQTDSIYQLGNDTFREHITLSDMKTVLSHFYQFGRISQVDVSDFKSNTASYELKIGDKKALMALAIDSNYRYSLLQLTEIQTSTLKKEPVISKVDTRSPLDFEVDSIAQLYIRKENTQSLAIGVIHKNQISTFFYGETAKGNKTLPTENSIYEIGSISKTFTATLLADLVEKGTIQLDDSIAKYLPDSIAKNPFLQTITFRSLANHTSGLPRLPTNLESSVKFNVQDPYNTYGRKELFSFLKNYHPQENGEITYEYSNLGYGLLGELLSIITNKPYAQLVKEVITLPLNMTSTTEKLNPKTQQLVPPHDATGKEVPSWNFQALAATGALKSTVKDLLAYAQIQFKMPLTPLENAMMLTRQFTYFIPPNTDIGLAWHMSMVDGITAYWHNGGTAGSSTFIGLIPDQKSAVIVLSNAALSVDEISFELLEKIITTK